MQAAAQDQPGNTFGKVNSFVSALEEQQADDGKDVEDDEEDESQLTQSTHSIADDSQQRVHGWPHLRQFQHTQLHTKQRMTLLTGISV